MALIDLLKRALSRPVERAVHTPVQDTVREVLASYDFASPEELRSVHEELQRTTTELEGLSERLVELTHMVDRLRQESEEARTEADHARTQAEVARADAEQARAEAEEARAGAELARTQAAQAREEAISAQKEVALAREGDKADEPEPRKRGRKPLDHLGCKVPDCTELHRSKGFCSRHYQAWRRGRLDGYVGPGGLVEHQDGALRVDTALQGEAYVLKGRAPGITLRVGGRKVKWEAA